MTQITKTLRLINQIPQVHFLNLCLLDTLELEVTKYMETIPITCLHQLQAFMNFLLMEQIPMTTNMVLANMSYVKMKLVLKKRLMHKFKIKLPKWTFVETLGSALILKDK